MRIEIKKLLNLTGNIFRFNFRFKKYWIFIYILLACSIFTVLLGSIISAATAMLDAGIVLNVMPWFNMVTGIFLALLFILFSTNPIFRDKELALYDLEKRYGYKAWQITGARILWIFAMCFATYFILFMVSLIFGSFGSVGSQMIYIKAFVIPFVWYLYLLLITPMLTIFVSLVLGPIFGKMIIYFAIIFVAFAPMVSSITSLFSAGGSSSSGGNYQYHDREKLISAVMYKDYFEDMVSEDNIEDGDAFYTMLEEYNAVVDVITGVEIPKTNKQILDDLINEVTAVLLDKSGDEEKYDILDSEKESAEDVSKLGDEQEIIDAISSLEKAIKDYKATIDLPTFKEEPQKFFLRRATRFGVAAWDKIKILDGKYSTIKTFYDRVIKEIPKHELIPNEYWLSVIDEYDANMFSKYISKVNDSKYKTTVKIFNNITKEWKLLSSLFSEHDHDFLAWRNPEIYAAANGLKSLYDTSLEVMVFNITFSTILDELSKMKFPPESNEGEEGSGKEPQPANNLLKEGDKSLAVFLINPLNHWDMIFSAPIQSYNYRLVDSYMRTITMSTTAKNYDFRYENGHVRVIKMVSSELIITLHFLFVIGMYFLGYYLWKRKILK